MESEEVAGPVQDGSIKADSSPTQSRPTKRLRTARACDQCRGRKYKCDGNQPSCQPCLNVGLACSYGASPKKRGLPTGYVKLLESLWALVFSVIPNSEVAVQRLLRDVEVSQDGEGKLLVTSPLVGSSSILKHRWTSSAVRLEVERLVSSLDKDLETSAHNSEKKDPTSLSRLPEEPTLTPASFTAWDNLPNETVRAPWLGSEGQISSSLQENLSTDALPEDTWHLLEIFFTYTHCWFPIFEKHIIWQTFYSAAEGQCERSNMAALWAILAYASRQKARADFQNSAQSISEPWELASQAMYNRSRNLIYKANFDAEPAAVQALLMLSMVEIDRGSWWTAWLLIGQAVRMAILLLNQHENADRSHKNTPNALYRILQGSFILDTVVSSRIHQLPHLRSQDVSDIEPVNEEGSEEWDPWTESPNLKGNRKQDFLPPRGPSRTLSIFNTFTGLMKILNDVVCNANGALHSESLYHERSMYLRTWFNNLPKHCLLPKTLPSNNQNNGTPISPQLLNLHLAYESVLSLLDQKIATAGQSSLISGETSQASGKSIPQLLKVFSHLFGFWTMPSLFEFYGYTGVETESSSHHRDTRLDISDVSQPVLQGVRPEFLPENASRQKNQHDHDLPLQPNYYAKAVEIAPHPLMQSDPKSIASIESPLSSNARIPKDSFLSTFPITPLTANSVDQLSETPNLLSDMSSSVSNYDTVLPLGTGFMLADENRMEDPTLTAGVDWTSVSSQFMQNLGFAIADGGLSVQSDNPFDLEEWAYGGEAPHHNKE